MGFDDIVDKAKDLAGDAAEAVKGAAEKVGDAAGDAFEAVKDKAEDVFGDDEPPAAQ